MNIKPIHRFLGADTRCSLCESVDNTWRGSHGAEITSFHYTCRKTGVEANTPCTNADRFYCPVGKDVPDA